MRYLLIATVVFQALGPMAIQADDLWLAAGDEFPGRLRVSQGETAPQVVLSRNPSPDPAYPHAVMKVGQIAVGHDQAIYYCSGLDGSIMHLLDDRHEIQVLEVAGQVRDLACTAEEHTVYYSVVSTPQDGRPLAAGQIFRRDLGEGSPQLVATIEQAAIGGNWWGTFTMRDSDIYLATLDSPSRIYKWCATALTREFTTNRYDIRGISVAGNGDFLFVDGSGEVWRTVDFTSVQRVLSTSLRLTDVNSRALSTTQRP